MITETLDRRALGALVIVLLLAAAPHAVHLPLWVVAGMTCIASWRVWLLWRGGAMPGRWLLIAIAMMSSAGVLLFYRTLFGREAGVALLVLMLGIKLLEIRTRRDVTVVIFLAYFLVVTSFFYSQTVPTAIYMLLLVWAITAVMLAFQYYASAPAWRSIARTAAALLLQGMPVMLVLFVLFPRIQGPLWGIPQSSYSATSGLSDTMAPGSLSELSLSDAVAFRVQFERLPEKPAQLYWRGPVLWDFDGRTWTSGTTGATVARPRFEALADPLRYTVTLEPQNLRWMFGIDLPALIPPNAALTTDYQMLSTQSLRNRIRYDMISVPIYRLDRELRVFDKERALRLPLDSNLRAVALARGWAELSRDHRAVVNQALARFRSEPFFYTLVPPLLGAQPVDEFLYQTRRGFCEHFASSFVFLMRAAGVPARVVTGYLGGEVNSLGNYLIVRQSDAHAWAEVWLENEGWVRVDPTAAVSPARIESGIAAALPAGEPLPMLVRVDWEWLRDMRFAWDALANSWNQWVLGYTPDRQSRLLQFFGFSHATWQNMIIALMSCSVVVVLILAAITLRDLRGRSRDPVLQSWQRFCKSMARAGAARLPHEGPLDYGRRLARHFPQRADELLAITRSYAALRYAPSSSKPSLHEFKQRIAQL